MNRAESDSVSVQVLVRGSLRKLKVSQSFRFLVLMVDATTPPVAIRRRSRVASVLPTSRDTGSAKKESR